MRAATQLTVSLMLLAWVNAAERTYFIAADEVVWDYVPTNRNGETGSFFNETDMGMEMDGMHGPSFWVLPSSRRIGRYYKKALYREYTDASFSTLKPHTTDWEHLGYLGPLIRAEVGDSIKVVFKNNANISYSIHPHGVFYTKQNSGVPDNNNMNEMHGTMGDGDSSGMVLPGKTWTYVWLVPERAGPGPNDPSSLVWMYHSHVNEVRDTNSGLVGPIIITRSGAGDGNGRPTDVDREFVVMFTILNENSGWYLDENIATFLPTTEMDHNMNGTMNSTTRNLKEDQEFITSNEKHTVNGFLYANLPGLSMMVNETVRWYVLSIGDEPDIHGSHWHGETLLYEGHRVDVIELIPASMKVLDMIPDNPGQWRLHCHTNHHIMAGMTATFSVMPCPTDCPRLLLSSASLIHSAYPFLLLVVAMLLC